MNITFNKLSDYPIATEESSLCPLNTNYLISFGGFNTGQPSGIHTEYYHKKNMHLFKSFFNPTTASKYVRGFKPNVFLYSIPNNTWSALPNYPGEPRQAIRSINVDGIIYTWGGFSYSPANLKKNLSMKKWPNKRNFKAYIDGYALKTKNNNQNNESIPIANFFWEKLADLPLPLSNFSIGHLNKKIYICCGGTHNPLDNTGKLDVVINNKNINEHLWYFDLNDPSPKWQILSDFPGSPRINSACSIINDQIFIIGGLYINPLWTYQSSHIRCYNVLDNWKFNLITNKWSRLNDTPIHNGNFGCNYYNVFNNRYIVLLGGAYFSQSMILNKIIPAEKDPQYLLKIKNNLLPSFEIKQNTILIYDITTNTFNIASQPLFNYTNLPSYVINNNNNIYLLAGEQVPFVFDKTYYGCQSDLFIHGIIN